MNTSKTENIEFAVIDVETTGLFPHGNDRIVEFAVSVVGINGETGTTYDTLVNPMRDVGPTHIHGVTAEMVKNAPTFDEILPTVLSHLEGRILVAHNSVFDFTFLENELIRLGIEVEKVDGLCTMNLSKAAFPHLPSYRLETICNYLDITLEDIHVASADSSAASKVLLAILELLPENGLFEHLSSDEVERLKFRVPDSLREEDSNFHEGYRRDDASNASRKEQSKLGAMISRLPDLQSEGKLPISEYVDLLRRILADRIITDEETQELITIAKEYQISATEVKIIHREYLKRLVHLYLLDHRISKTEREDLELVARNLGVEDFLDKIIEEQEKKFDEDNYAYSNVEAAKVEGKTICFTGNMTAVINGEKVTRKIAQQIAFERGMVIKKGVTKKLDYLVAADPHSQSRKTKKARNYGVNILAEHVFWNMMGINI